MERLDGRSGLFLPFPEWFRFCAGIAVAVTVPGLELQLLTLYADRGAGRDGVGDKHIGTNHAVPADGGAAAQDRRACVDRHVVLNGGVALFPPQALAASGGQSAQGHALIDLDMVADDRRLPHHNAGPVVDEEILADDGAGVDVDTGDAVGVFRHDPGQQGNAEGIQNMGQAVNGNGKQPGIAEDDLVGAECGGISVVKGFHICLGDGPDAGDGPKELQAQLLGFLFRLRGRHGAAQYDGDLLVQIVHDVLNQHGEVVLGVVNAVGSVPGEARVDNAQKLADHVDHHILVRMLKRIELVDIPVILVVHQDAVYDVFNLLFNGSHSNPSFEMARG